jgi:hypothetical protein
VPQKVTKGPCGPALTAAPARVPYPVDKTRPTARRSAKAHFLQSGLEFPGAQGAAGALIQSLAYTSDQPGVRDVAGAVNHLLYRITIPSVLDALPLIFTRRATYEKKRSAFTLRMEPYLEKLP